jgi:hypothetical protein
MDTPGGHTHRPDRPDSGNRPHPHGFCDTLTEAIKVCKPGDTIEIIGLGPRALSSTPPV